MAPRAEIADALAQHILRVQKRGCRRGGRGGRVIGGEGGGEEILALRVDGREDRLQAFDGGEEGEVLCGGEERGFIYSSSVSLCFFQAGGLEVE